MRILLFVMLALGGLSSSDATAGAQSDPLGTVTSAIPTIASPTTIASGLTGGTTSGDSGLIDAVSGSTDGVLESGVLSGTETTGATSSDTDGGSESASRDDASSGSNRGSSHTKFDRLPRRVETLLERIESGRNVRASIARLSELLGSSSPQLRARVMRLIRLEIRRLERGGLTGRERAAAQRLRRLQITLEAQGSQFVSSGQVQSSGIRTWAESGGGVLGATAGSESRPAESPTDGRGGPIANPRLPLPSPPSQLSLPYWLLLLATIAGVMLFVAGASRHTLPLPVRGTVEVPQDVWVVGAAVIFSVVAGLVAVLLIEAVAL
jgi:hypothetical protein